MTTEDVKPGQRIRVIQEIERREGNWRTEVEGVVQAVRRDQTGSWYAHSKNGQLWLLRIDLRKDDGELSSLVVDSLTQVELLADAPPVPPG